MRKLNYLFIIGLTLLLFSCTIESTTHFNKNKSGYSSTTIDMEGLMDFANGMGGEADLGEGNFIDSIIMMFEGNYEAKGNNPEADEISMMIDSVKMVMADSGMKNFKFQKDGEYGINMSYDFDDYSILSDTDLFTSLSQTFGGDALGEDMMGSGGDSNMFSGASIRKEGKWMIIDLASGMSFEDFQKEMNQEFQSEDGEETGMIEDDMGMQMLEMMGAMFQFEQTYSFHKKIKEVETNFPYTKTKKTITISYDYSDMMEIWEDGGNLEIRVRL